MKIKIQHTHFYLQCFWLQYNEWRNKERNDRYVGCCCFFCINKTIIASDYNLNSQPSQPKWISDFKRRSQEASWFTTLLLHLLDKVIQLKNWSKAALNQDYVFALQIFCLFLNHFSRRSCGIRNVIQELNKTAADFKHYMDSFFFQVEN